MRIAGRLKDTTLGDVLGSLGREKATGFLEIHELGKDSGKVHRIALEDGAITGVDSTAGPRIGMLLDLDAERSQTSGDIRTGEAWLLRGLISEEKLRGALRAQAKERLEFLFRLGDAELRFRAPRPKAEDPTAPPPLLPGEVLPGRARKRERSAERPSAPSTHRSQALTVLGLSEGASLRDVQMAFRTLAQKLHPDRHPAATPAEKREMMQRFSEVSRAYHTLVA